MPEHPFDPGRQIPDPDTRKRQDRFIELAVLGSIPLGLAVVGAGTYLTTHSQADIKDAVAKAGVAKLEIGHRRTYPTKSGDYLRDRVTIERGQDTEGKACYTVWNPRQPDFWWLIRKTNICAP